MLYMHSLDGLRLLFLEEVEEELRLFRVRLGDDLNAEPAGFHHLRWQDLDELLHQALLDLRGDALLHFLW